ncbi:MAG: hypothetical protein JSW05_07515 [Candidatus Thorarchaeota archaeon]|nr:MAG: hypothetical protein JSW05_07515 [Candidatus Thorarchaeota archaeon]
MTRKVDDLYECEECRLLYRDVSWAQKCEEWCKKYKSCNLEITAHAVNKTDLIL